ncbi:uncharacterized protein LOC106665124 [Cimex lectularius]|uniref:Uncharacterized protein n=1 Tax=Cimex lectularius TaxID=79782 RepID=A0A8I6RIH0_CIMLE|nr:uncharacterized protein LOC106665124 [Cimex lectularius]
MDVRARSLAADKRNCKNDKKVVKEDLSPWDKDKDTLTINSSACSTNWNLLASRLAKLEDQLSKLDAEATIGDHLRPRPSARASRSASSQRQSDSSDEASKRPSQASSPSHSSRSPSRPCSPDLKYYRSVGSVNRASPEDVVKDVNRTVVKEDKTVKSTTGVAGRLRASGKRSTAVLKYFADKADDRKTENPRPANSGGMNKHAVKSAVIENFSNGKTLQYKASRDSLTKENIKKFVTPAREKHYQRLLTNRDSMFPRSVPKVSAKYEERNFDKAIKPKDEETANQHDSVIPFSKLKTKSETKRKAFNTSPKNLLTDLQKAEEPLAEAESRLEETLSKTSKDSAQTSKKVKNKRDDAKSGKSKGLKKKSKSHKSEVVIKKNEAIKVKPKVLMKPKKTTSTKTPETREEIKKYPKSAKASAKNSPKTLSKRGSSVSKVGSSPRMSPSASVGNTFPKEITKRALFKSNFGSLSPRMNFGTPSPRSGSNCSTYFPNNQGEESPVRVSGVPSSRTSYNNAFPFGSRDHSNEARKMESVKRRPPSDTVFGKNERKKSGRVSLVDKNSFTSENASNLLTPKTRHLTDMEVQILVKDVEQISGQIQKYIRKWDELLKTNTTADRDEDIRKTVLSACVLLDTKLKRAKELLMKYKALTSGNNGLGSPTAEMLEALLYYQLTQLDVASVIKTFRRLDSMLTSGK